MITDGGGHEAAAPVRESWAGSELAQCPPIEPRSHPLPSGTDQETVMVSERTVLLTGATAH